MTIYLTYIMEFNKQNIQSKVTATESHVIDEGLRAYMLKVYNYMCTGLFLTGIVSLIVFKAAGGYNITLSSSGYVGVTSFGNFLLNTWFMWIVALSPFCLLYTSPSPRDGLLSRMPSSA